MPVTRRRLGVTAKEELKDEMIFIAEEESSVTEMEVQRKKLRQRWELASILHFLNVFEPVIKSNLKISAEEIEAALIEPNDSLAQLHIALLKGVVPSRKTLNEAWVFILSKKLAMWWPWVAEGDFPLTAAKGEEMTRYKELDPTTRLLILKALCEIRADQDDVVSFVNDGIKNVNDISTFQKEKLGGDGNGTFYWYDGNSITGHRLYKEVRIFDRKPKTKGKETKLAINSRWETIATNLEEFRKVANEFSSSEVQLEVTVGKAVKADAIPALQRLRKKKERLLKLHQRQDMLLNGFQHSAIFRSSRNHRPVNYKFEEYDRAIKEAIEVTQKRKSTEDQRHEVKHSKCEKRGQNVSIGAAYPPNIRDSGSTESDTDGERHQEGDDRHDCNDDCKDITDGGNRYSKNFDQENNKTDHKNDLVLHFQNRNGWLVQRPKGSRHSERLAGNAEGTVSETMSSTTKQRLRQRPTVDSASESAIVPDSEDENSSKDTEKKTSAGGNSSSTTIS